MSKRKKSRLSYNRKRYRIYKKSFEKRVDSMIQAGFTPYDAIPLTYTEYLDMYTRYKNDRKKEIDSGKRKSLGNINSTIISNQVYELSEEQAYSIFNYMKTLSDEDRKRLNFDFRNINKAIMKIRQGDYVREDLDLWDIIRARRENLYNLPKEELAKILESMGLKSTGRVRGDIASIVTNEFFYPKEKGTK